MKTKKRAYLDECMRLPVSWLRESAENPSPYMTKIHVKLHYIAIRIKGHSKRKAYAITE